MTELIRYDAMCQAISEAYKVDEAKGIRDKAIAVEVYARQAKNTVAERMACEIRIRAERKTGELLRNMEKAKAGRPPDNGQADSMHFRGAKTLADMGISREQSSNSGRV
jgi:hypothetical protein